MQRPEGVGALQLAKHFKPNDRSADRGRLNGGLMQTDGYGQAFFQMEMERRLFSKYTPNGDPFWDVVRYDVFGSLLDELNEPGSVRNPSGDRSAFGWLAKFLSSPLKIMSMGHQWAQLNSIRPTDIMTLVHSRYNDGHGNWIDFATNDAVKAISRIGSIHNIESVQDRYPSPNITTLIYVAARLHRLSAHYEQYFREAAAGIADAEKMFFGKADPHLLRVIRWAYKRHAVERRIWRKILERAQPRLVLMVQNGIQKGLILEARRRRIPVVECQHGVINLMHMAYSYPPDLPAGETVLVPDGLILFSEYWKRQCCMPGTRLVAAGNNRFSSAGALSTRTGATVFVSAGPFQKYLSPLAIDVARFMPDRTFIMKLHPHQMSDRARIEKELQGIPNLAVVGMEKSCPEVFVDASDVVIVESTAAYEALDRGVPVHVLRKDCYISHQDLFWRPDVHLFDTSDELREKLFLSKEIQSYCPRYFDAFDNAAFLEFVQKLLLAPEQQTDRATLR